MLTTSGESSFAGLEKGVPDPQILGFGRCQFVTPSGARFSFWGGGSPSKSTINKKGGQFWSRVVRVNDVHVPRDLKRRLEILPCLQVREWVCLFVEAPVQRLFTGKPDWKAGRQTFEVFPVENPNADEIGCRMPQFFLLQAVSASFGSDSLDWVVRPLSSTQRVPYESEPCEALLWLYNCV